MFTGLVETTGTINSMKPKGDMIVMEITAKDKTFDSEHGASIAINGCCLTVTEFDKINSFLMFLLKRFDKTNLNTL